MGSGSSKRPYHSWYEYIYIHIPHNKIAGEFTLFLLYPRRLVGEPSVIKQGFPKAGGVIL